MSVNASGPAGLEMWASSPLDASGCSYFGGAALGSALLAPDRRGPPGLCAMRSSRGRRSNQPTSLTPASGGGYSTITSKLIRRGFDAKGPAGLEMWASSPLDASGCSYFGGRPSAPLSSRGIVRGLRICVPCARREAVGATSPHLWRRPPVVAARPLPQGSASVSRKVVQCLVAEDCRPLSLPVGERPLIDPRTVDTEVDCYMGLLPRPGVEWGRQRDQ